MEFDAQLLRFAKRDDLVVARVDGALMEGVEDVAEFWCFVQADNEGSGGYVMLDRRNLDLLRDAADRVADFDEDDETGEANVRIENRAADGALFVHGDDRIALVAGPPIEIRAAAFVLDVRIGENSELLPLYDLWTGRTYRSAQQYGRALFAVADAAYARVGERALPDDFAGAIVGAMLVAKKDWVRALMQHYRDRPDVLDALIAAEAELARAAAAGEYPRATRPPRARRTRR